MEPSSFGLFPRYNSESTDTLHMWASENTTEVTLAWHPMLWCSFPEYLTLRCVQEARDPLGKRDKLLRKWRRNRASQEESAAAGQGGGADVARSRSVWKEGVEPACNCRCNLCQYSSYPSLQAGELSWNPAHFFLHCLLISRFHVVREWLTCIRHCVPGISPTAHLQTLSPRSHLRK